MIRAYEYAFYWVYSWQMRVWRNTAEISAVLFLTMVIYYNALAAFTFAEGASGRPLLPGGLTKTHVLVFGAVAFAVQYLALISSGRHKALLARYCGEPQSQRQLRGLFILSYAVLSFILVICASVYRRSSLHV